MKLKLPLSGLLLILLSSINSFSQSVGINNPAPSSSAVLDVTSTSKGLLAPRMTSAQRLGIVAPATGLLVYETTTNQFFYFDGLVWKPLSSSSSGWNVIGNAGTNASTNFLGTTDNADMVVRTSNIEKMRITTTGNVGIGTSTPFGQLTAVAPASLANRGIWSAQYNTSQAGVIIGARKSRGTETAPLAVAANDYGGVFLSQHHDGTSYLANGNFGYRITGAVSAGNIPGEWFFAASNANDNDPYANGTVRMVVESGGNVGIGTTSPTQRLTVSAGLNIDNNNANTGNLTNALLFGATGSGEGIASKQSAGGNQHGLDFYQAGANRMRIWNDGNVGIGETSSGSIQPAADLTVMDRATTDSIDVALFTAKHSGTAGTTWRMGSVEVYTEGFDNIGFSRQISPLAASLNNLGDPLLSKYFGFRWGTLYCTVAPNISSDTTLKEEITPVVYGLDQIRKITPISYKFKNDSEGTDRMLSKEEKRTHLGFSAQEIKQVLPEVVSSYAWVSDKEKGFRKAKTNTLGVYYDEIIPVLVNAVKDLDQQQQSMMGAMSVSDFGNIQSNGNEMRVEFSNEFSSRLNGQPIITVTSLLPDVTLYVTGISNSGFTVRSNSKNISEMNFNWIAVAKVSKNSMTVSSAYTEADHAKKLQNIQAFENSLPSQNDLISTK